MTTRPNTPELKSPLDASPEEMLQVLNSTTTHWIEIVSDDEDVIYVAVKRVRKAPKLESETVSESTSRSVVSNAPPEEKGNK